MSMRVATYILLAFPSRTGLEAADCNRNGAEDQHDVDEGSSPDCNGNSRPDECDITEDPFDFSLSSQVDLGTSTTFADLVDMDADGLSDVVALKRDAA